MSRESSSPTPSRWWAAQQRAAPYLFLAPFFLLFAVFVIYPLLRSFVLSFHKTVGPGQEMFAGLDNYRFIFEDPTFKEALKHSVLLLLCVPVLLVFSILLATLRYELGGPTANTNPFAPQFRGGGGRSGGGTGGGGSGGGGDRGGGGRGGGGGGR